ncbi:hypothetical protein ACH4MJ_04755 [Streptomyces anulatus]
MTLAYMIEPNPGRRGMLGRYSYASHGIRFAIKGPTESSDSFQRRLAEQAEHQSDGLGNPRAFEFNTRWLVGPRARNLGSLHADIWRGSAAELADCGTLAVYPVGGWWKANRRNDRIGLPVSYALLISLRTPEVSTDLHTPIATRLGVSIGAAPHAQTEIVDGIPIQMEFGWWTRLTGPGPVSGHGAVCMKPATGCIRFVWAQGPYAPWAHTKGHSCRRLAGSHASLSLFTIHSPISRVMVVRPVAQRRSVLCGDAPTAPFDRLPPLVGERRPALAAGETAGVTPRALWRSRGRGGPR